MDYLIKLRKLIQNYCNRIHLVEFILQYVDKIGDVIISALICKLLLILENHGSLFMSLVLVVIVEENTSL